MHHFDRFRTYSSAPLIAKNTIFPRSVSTEPGSWREASDKAGSEDPAEDFSVVRLLAVEIRS